MALKDLVQSTNKIEDRLEKILKNRTHLISVGEERNIRIDKELVKKLKNPIRILLYLAGRLAWSLIDKTEYWVKPKEIERELLIPGGSVRPILMNFKKERLIEFNKKERGYKINSLGILRLENFFKKYEKNKKDKN